MIAAFAVVMVKRFWYYAAGKYRLILCGLALVFIALVPLMQSAFWAEADTVKNAYENNGVAAGFVHSAVQTLNSGKKPANYNDSEVEKVVNSIQSEDEANADSDTNIIVILGEAVMDTDMLSGVGFTADPMPTIHRVMHEFPSGYVTVEMQGGGTCSAESQVLTGLREVNYTKLAASNRYLPSLATVLEQYGYQTYALHSYFGWFYDRYDIMRLLGFNELICQTNFIKPLTVYGTWPQDSCLYEDAMDVMMESDGTDFCYLVTMETHGDYKYKMEDKNWFTNELDYQSASQVNTICQC